MKCPLLKVKEYKQGFNADLLFTGFRGNKIYWMGNDHEWSKHQELQQND